jgi:Secretion system C-terminal sorting domain
MKTWKIVAVLVLSLFAAQRSLGQMRDEPSFHDKGDPVKSVQLFPNPATDYLTIKFELPHAKTIKLAMNTIIGNSLEVEAEVVDDFEVRIKVRDLPSGYYLLAIHDGEANSQNTYKFLKR